MKTEEKCTFRNYFTVRGGRGGAEGALVTPEIWGSKYIENRIRNSTGFENLTTPLQKAKSVYPEISIILTKQALDGRTKCTMNECCFDTAQRLRLTYLLG